MQRLRRGIQQPLSAGTWNSFVDTAQAFKNARELGSPTRDLPLGDDRPDRVTIENLTGANLRLGEVVELGEFLLNEVKPQNAWFEGLEVDLSQNRHTFGVMLKPTPADKFGKCLVVGACVARVAVWHEDHQYARLVDGSPVMESDYFGQARLLSKPAIGEGGGEQLCWVYVGDEGPLNLIGKATEAILSEASGECEIWAGVPGSEEATGVTVQGFNKTEDIAADDWVSLTRVGRYWYVAGLGCPEEEA